MEKNPFNSIYRRISEASGLIDGVTRPRSRIVHPSGCCSIPSNVRENGIRDAHTGDEACTSGGIQRDDTRIVFLRAPFHYLSDITEVIVPFAFPSIAPRKPCHVSLECLEISASWPVFDVRERWKHL